MRLPLEFYDVLRTRINLSDIVGRIVSLTRKSNEYIGLCPFHSEKSPSFTVNNAKKFYHCFGCGAHGDVIKFVSDTSGLSYNESAVKLATDHGIELPKIDAKQAKLYEESEQIINILELAASFFALSLNNDARSYLAKRGINEQKIKEFSIGYSSNKNDLQRFFAEKSIPLMMLERAGLVVKQENGNIYEVFRNRVIFPIRNIYNKIIGFGGRVIGEGMPKYLNSPETIIFKKSEVLYGENKALPAAHKKNYIIIVEGYLDVISLNMAGFYEVVATLGTAVTEHHVHKLWNMADEIVVCLDGDEAGIRATKKLIKLVMPLISCDKKISFIKLANNLDPDNLISKNGRDAFQVFLDARINLSQMIWDIEYIGNSINSAEERANLENKLASYAKEIKDQVLSTNYQRFFKEQFWSHLIKFQKDKTKNNVSATDIARLRETSPDYSEIEILEHAFCTMLIKFPVIIKNDDVKDFILKINFSKVELREFVDWLFDLSSIIDDLEIENLKKMVENSRFYDIYLLLSEPNCIFLSKIEFDDDKIKNINCLILWQLLCKKYQSLLLKSELEAMLQNDSGDTSEKIKFYQTEFLAVEREIQQLNSSLINR